MRGLVYKILFSALIFTACGCAGGERNYKNALNVLSKIEKNVDTMQDWHALVKSIEKSDASYSILIQEKCFNVFHGKTIHNYKNFQNLRKESQKIVLDSIKYGRAP